MDFLIAILAIVIGLAICFAGYRWLWILLPFWGFFAGLWLGYTGIQTIFGAGFLSGVSGIVIGLILGVIFAVLSYLFYFVGVAILGATVGYGLTMSIFTGAFGMNPNFFIWLIAIAVGALAAFLTLGLNLQKYVIIAITALGGASAVIAGVLVMFGPGTAEDLSGKVGVFAPVSFQDGAIWWILWAVLAIAGIVYQIMSNRVYVLEPPPARY
jgi:hypothetical protein